MYVVIRQHTVSSFVLVIHMDISMSHLHLSSRGIKTVTRGSICIRVETGLGHPVHQDHILSRSNGSNLVYIISGPDPDSALDHVC